MEGQHNFEDVTLRITRSLVGLVSQRALLSPAKLLLLGCAASRSIAETNRIHFVPLGAQNKTFGPYLVALTGSSLP
jgi:hypothetical protein